MDRPCSRDADLDIDGFSARVVLLDRFEACEGRLILISSGIHSGDSMYTFHFRMNVRVFPDERSTL